MQIDASKSQNFAMSYTTKSGKQLSLSMYDKQSVDYTKDGDGTSLSLRRQYGFSFSYEGSKLTQEDINELKTAMKDIEPMLQEFLANSKVKELQPKELIESALKMANVLPTPKDENHQNAIMDTVLTSLENLVKNNKTPNKEENLSMLEDSKKLIEELFTQMKKQLEKQQISNQDKGFNLYI